MQFIERKLRERFTLNVESIDEETCSVISALWLQALTSQRMDYTVASSREGPVFGQALGSVSSVFDKWFIENKSIHKEDVFVALLPLARFVSSFPTLQEIKGHEELFMAHPTTPNSFGITPSGLKVRPLKILFTSNDLQSQQLINRHVRAFMCRRRDLIGLRWNSSHMDSIKPADPESVKRALEIALFRADASATDELMNGARNRVIARHMPKLTLYDFAADPFVRSKDFYLAMRETDPSALNVAHRAGSVPPLLALKEDGTALQEIYLALILLHCTPLTFEEDTIGDVPLEKRSRPGLGYFVGLRFLFCILCQSI